MIHGEHYAARISSETAHAANIQRPWERNIAKEVINFLAKSLRTEILLTGSAGQSLSDLQISTLDLIYILENGIIWGLPEKTSRKEYFKYKIVGSCLDDTGLRLSLTVIPNHIGASLNITKISVTES